MIRGVLFMATETSWKDEHNTFLRSGLTTIKSLIGLTLDGFEVYSSDKNELFIV